MIKNNIHKIKLNESELLMFTAKLDEMLDDYLLPADLKKSMTAFKNSLLVHHEEISLALHAAATYKTNRYLIFSIKAYQPKFIHPIGPGVKLGRELKQSF